MRLAERSLKTKCTNPVFYSFLLFFFLLSPSLGLGLAALFPPPKPLLPLFILIKFCLRFRSLIRFKERK